MSRSESSSVHRQLHALYDVGALGALTDGQLLEMFTARRDEAAEHAFGVLIRRHGPMVLGVCRRILRDPDDSADAFQATFLVLVRRARSVRVTDSLGRWLYGVSRRVALQAKASAVRRAAREGAGARDAVAAAPDWERAERLALLDQEVARLPEKYRAAVVLCDLGGLTHEAAARQLGCPVGTIESRLGRGRRLLRARLTRLGVTPAAIVAVLSARSATAGVPRALIEATTAAALRLSTGDVAAAETISATVAQLMKGTLRTMLWDHVKVAVPLLLSAGLLAGGASVLIGQERREGPNAPLSGEGPASQVGEKPGDHPEMKPDDRATIATLERRLRALETKLDAALGLLPGGDPGRGPQASRRPGIDPDAIRRIRPRFESLVEKVRVKVGQEVKKGEPLAELFSTELAAAKNDYLGKTVQGHQDRSRHDLLKKLVESGATSQQLWIDIQNAEARSRFEECVARDRLLIGGLSQPEIDAVKDEDGEQKARYMLRAPVDGTVIEIEAAPDDLVGPKDVLMEIAGAKR